MAHFVIHKRFIIILVYFLQCSLTEQSPVNYFYQDIERKNIVKRGLLSQFVDTIWHIIYNFTGASFKATRSTPSAGSVRTNPPPPTDNTGVCGDNESCSSWQFNGFCENAFYALEFRKRWCGVYCGLCTGY
ncbi:unnamed protein product [Cylicocyclus nassatus]|uniref:ShKT domain-containing protein n=1 Tax=Cylicocyclus nassatus TaxID=53992 RepID=A0AA36M816_CYLNA|nr:unnamed protein product [Cylicocyclus nassatus]